MIPPPDVQDAMTRQMSAERTRRAQVHTEAEGTNGRRTITVAEGPENRPAVTVRAEGNRQAAILQAEGYAQALETVFEGAAAKKIDAKTMGLQYLDALKALGSSPATKFVIPMEFAGLLSKVTGLAEQSFREGDVQSRR